MFYKHAFLVHSRLAVSFYVYENHTVIEASMKKCVLQIHVPSLMKISCVVVANGMDILLPLCFKPQFVKYFVMCFGYITLVYVLPVWKLMTDFLMTLLNTCHC